jgi:hypothetical protein
MMMMATATIRKVKVDENQDFALDKGSFHARLSDTIRLIHNHYTELSYRRTKPSMKYRGILSRFLIFVRVGMGGVKVKKCS